MLENIHRKDHIEETVLSGSQFFGTERVTDKFADAQPFPKQDADLRILVEAAAARLDRHYFDASPMKNERHNPYAGADFKNALSREIDSFQK